MNVGANVEVVAVLEMGEDGLSAKGEKPVVKAAMSKVNCEEG